MVLEGWILFNWLVKPKEIYKTGDRREEKKKFAAYFGKHLQKIRKNKKISQEKLSMDAGYYRTFVNKIEGGHYSPSLHTVWRLAHALGLSLSDFFKSFK